MTIAAALPRRGMAGLIITNGDSAADLLRAAGADRDDPAVARRAARGADRATGLDGMHAPRACRTSPTVRPRRGGGRGGVRGARRVMRRHADFDRIELWFEHDLYDQLQLLQVLAFFAGRRADRRADAGPGRRFPRARRRRGTILRFARPRGRSRPGRPGLRLIGLVGARRPDAAAGRRPHGARRAVAAAVPVPAPCAGSSRSCPRRPTGSAAPSRPSST